MLVGPVVVPEAVGVLLVAALVVVCQRVLTGRNPLILPWMVLRAGLRDPRGTLQALSRDGAPVPVDPSVLSAVLTVPPSGGGAGWTCRSPGPSEYPPRPLRPGSYGQDAAVRLARGAFLLVVRTGPLGQTAPERAAASREGRATHERVGLVTTVATPLGTAYRHTFRPGGGTTWVTDWHVDHDGHGFIVGLLRREEDSAWLLPVVDAIMATWSWLPARSTVTS